MKTDVESAISIPALEKKFSANPASLVFSRLADGYRKKGDIAQAITVCNTGLQSHPEYVTGHIILGRCHLEQGQMAEAIQSFSRAVSLDRVNQVAIKMLADIFIKQGMDNKSDALYTLLARLDPDNSLFKKYQSNTPVDLSQLLGLTSASAALPVTQEWSAPDNGDSATAMQYEDINTFNARQDSPLSSATDILDDSGAEELGSTPVESHGEAIAETIDDLNGEQVLFSSVDVGDRIDSMFGQSSPAPEQTEIIDVPNDASAFTADLDATQAFSMQTIAENSIVQTEPGSISGSDVQNRLSELFTDDALTTPPDSLQPDSLLSNESFDSISVSDITTANTISTDTVATQLLEKTTTIDESLFATDDTLSRVETESISSSDISDRLDSMFGQPDKGATDLLELPQIDDSTMTRADEGPDTANTINATDETIIMSRASLPFADTSITDDTKALNADTVALPHAAIQSRIDDLFADDDQVTGETIQLSRETLTAAINHGNEPAADLLFNSEEVENLADFQNTALAAATIPDALIAISPMDTVMAEGIQKELISGDDVLSRLSEIMSDDSFLGDSTGMAALPEDEDLPVEPVSQGFYTMSGENAESGTADSDMLDKLDADGVDHSESILSELPATLSDNTTFELSSPFTDETIAPAPALDQTNNPFSDEVSPFEDVTLATGSISDPTIIATAETTSDAMNAFDLQDDPFLEPTLMTPLSPLSDSSNDDLLDSIGHQPLFDEPTEIAPPDAAPAVAISAPEEQSHEIPDHVLTPTLADIYLQQGQIGLAAAVYRRLRERDPENTKLALRCAEVELLLTEQVKTMAQNPVSPAKPAPRSATRQPRTAGLPAADMATTPKKRAVKKNKPLAGVRINKQVKARIKQSNKG